MAALQKLGVAAGVSHLDAHSLVPPVGYWSEPLIQSGAELGDERRQRVVKVLVLAPAEAVPRHHDTGAKAPLLIVERGQLPAFLRRDELIQHCIALGVEIPLQLEPV